MVNFKKILLGSISRMLLLILLTTFNVIICFSTAAMVIMQLRELGIGQQTVLILGILTAWATQTFIWCFHKIKKLIINY